MTAKPALRALLVALLAVGLILALGGPLAAAALGVPEPDAVVAPPFTTDHAPWGTDRLGHDVLSRALHGNVPLVLIPLTTAVIATTAGTVVGLALAWFPTLRTPVRFATDVLLTVPPVLILLIVATSGGGSALLIVAAAVVLSIPVSSRYLEAASRPLLASGFVEIARVEGRSPLDITLREVLPELSAPVATELSVRFTGTVYLVSTLAFLGGGSGGGGDDWASGIRDAISGLTLNPWSVVVPAIGIALLTVPPALLADREGRGVSR